MKFRASPDSTGLDPRYFGFFMARENPCVFTCNCRQIVCIRDRRALQATRKGLYFSAAVKSQKLVLALFCFFSLSRDHQFVDGKGLFVKAASRATGNLFRLVVLLCTGFTLLSPIAVNLTPHIVFDTTMLGISDKPYLFMPIYTHLFVLSLAHAFEHNA